MHTVAGEITASCKGLPARAAWELLRRRLHRARSLLLICRGRDPRHQIWVHLVGNHGRGRHVGARHRRQGRCGHGGRGRVRRVHGTRVARLLGAVGRVLAVHLELLEGLRGALLVVERGAVLRLMQTGLGFDVKHVPNSHSTSRRGRL